MSWFARAIDAAKRNDPAARLDSGDRFDSIPVFMPCFGIVSLIFYISIGSFYWRRSMLNFGVS